MKRVVLIIFIILGVVAAGVGAWFIYQQIFKPSNSINSYAECVAAGYPVLELYPEQCRTPDGRTFTNPDAQNSVPAEEFTSTKGVVITLEDWITQPRITSPLTISGAVPGNWSFEASFPVLITDEEGRVLTQSAAQLEGDWMTEEMVPFTVTLTFERPIGDSPRGFLVLQKDNPSGLPENDDSLSIPVTFE